MGAPRNEQVFARGAICFKCDAAPLCMLVIGGKSPWHSSYEKGCQEKKLLPAPLRDAGVVTYIQPHLIPHLIVRGVIGLVALARPTFPRQCHPQLLVPTRRFHVSVVHDAVRFRSYAS